MNAVHAVVGYLPASVAKASAAGRQKEPLQVRLDAGNAQVHAKINPSDVLGVLMGASRKGDTSVQVFLKPGAKVDMVMQGKVVDLALRPIKDYGFGWLRPPINVIYIDPQRIKNLVAAQVGTSKI